MRDQQVEVVKKALNAVLRSVPDEWAAKVLDAIQAQNWTVARDDHVAVSTD